MPVEPVEGVDYAWSRPDPDPTATGGRVGPAVRGWW